MSGPEHLLTCFEANAAAVQRHFGAIPEERLRERRVEGKWSAHENLAHLGQFHEAIRDRVGWILSQDNPTFGRFNPNEAPGTQVWIDKPSAQLLRDFAEERHKLVGELRALSPEQWSRVGTHGVFGTLTLSEWLQFWLQHEGHHIYTALVRART